MSTTTGLLFVRSAQDSTAVVELRLPGQISVPPVVELNGESWGQQRIHQEEDGSIEIVFTPLSTDDPPLMVIVETGS